MKNSDIIDARDISKQRIMEALRSIEKFNPTEVEKKWTLLLKKIPIGLREALLLELSIGNNIGTIQNGDWPQPGSVVIYLTSHFKNNFSKNSEIVKYRLLNDPHYWYEEISQTANGIEHLIIT